MPRERKDGLQRVASYKTSDGETWEDRKDAREHQKNLNRRKKVTDLFSGTGNDDIVDFVMTRRLEILKALR